MQFDLPDALFIDDADRLPVCASRLTLALVRSRRPIGALRWSLPASRVTLPLRQLGYVLTLNQPRQLCATEGAIMLQLTDVQKCTLSIQPLDAVGNPASVDGTPSWSVSDSSVLAIEPATDGLSAVVTAVGPLGTAQVNVSADADLGSGVTTLTGALDVSVAASAATTLNISTGVPENA